MFGRKRLLRLLAPALALALLSAACGDDDDATSEGTDTTTEDGATDTTTASTGGVDYGALSGSITGSGASFPDAFYQAVIDSFADDSELEVTYNSVGSGQGKKDFGSNLTDFGGTDSLVKDGDGPAAGTFLYVPTVAAPITVSYNLSGIDTLQLSPATIAKIFQRQVKKWDDAAVAADNPGVTLPSKDIVVAHRADGSGTTTNFTKYLNKAAAGTWTLGQGDTVAWPADTQAGQKNTGVAQIIKDNDGAIGYVDLSDAKATGLKFAAVKNKSGAFVEPTLEGTSAALEGAIVADDLSYDPLDADGADAYPITAPTYVLLRTTYEDQATLDSVVGFLTYVLNEGQEVAETVDFAKLPDSLRGKALAQLDKPTAG
jgi:phosphate transport system substrate-binding protein